MPLLVDLVVAIAWAASIPEAKAKTTDHGMTSISFAGRLAAGGVSSAMFGRVACDKVCLPRVLAHNLM